MISCTTSAGHEPPARCRWAGSYWLLALAGWLALAAPLHAVGGEAARAFRAGIEAADRGAWAQVVAEMERALGLEPAAGGRIKIYGMRFEAYVPHYWLGLAKDELGDCSGAARAFETARRLPDLEDLLMPAQARDLDVRLRRCRDELSAPPPPPPPETLSTTEPEQSAAPTRPAPPFLRRAAADYLAGRYDEVASMLEGLDALSEDPRVHATGLLLRGASHFALHRRQIEPDEALLERARSDLAAYRRLSPGERPSAFWFSPAFLALYDQTAP